MAGMALRRQRRKDPKFVKAVGEPLRMAVSAADVADSAIATTKDKMFKKLWSIK